MIRELQAEGATTVRAITEALNQRQVPTAAGRRWHVQTVHRLLRRLDSHPQAMVA